MKERECDDDALHPKTATATSRKRHENMIHSSYSFFVLKPALWGEFRGLWKESGIVRVAGWCHRYACLGDRNSQSGINDVWT